MKKALFALFWLTIITAAVAQDGEKTAQEQQNLNSRYWNIQSNSGSLYFQNPARKASGSVYFFPRWNNIGVIVTDKEEQLLIRNINLNLDQQAFESMISADSTHQYSFKNLDYILVNNKKYRQLEHEKASKVFEYIFESEGFDLLKLHTMKVVKGSPNPMVNRPKDRYTYLNTYYVKRKKKFKRFNLNERNVVGLLTSSGIEEAAITQFVTENKMSYKDEFNVQMLLKHFLDKK